jgi:hypothetical protein
MELLAIESSRIVYLTQVFRPSGQLYFPDAVTKLVERYSFFKAPSPDQVLPLTFSVGKFQDAQIAEFAIYNDGFIVSSASDTDLLDAFIDDLLSWSASEFGLIQMAPAKSEKFYESSVVVKATSNLSESLRPQNDLAATLAKALKSAKISAPLKLGGFIFDFDPSEFSGKRKPFRLVVDRRVGVPFAENIFYSQAPFRTKDHLNVLRSLEEMVSGNPASRHRAAAAGRSRPNRS